MKFFAFAPLLFVAARFVHAGTVQSNQVSPDVAQATDKTGRSLENFKYAITMAELTENEMKTMIGIFDRVSGKNLGEVSGIARQMSKIINDMLAKMPKSMI
ncbi:hypothetical protein LPJ66_000321 [Kickxella alabastrina]|uniref:Uncharacterized protein n=1 Tax=Kickxella alabastrina TaxID=61397 RepID=A0ACC1IWC5_9FUNG|nr:hypothetical protein LPJ66_000321 [Kickxella alabastrina]